MTNYHGIGWTCNTTYITVKPGEGLMRGSSTTFSVVRRSSPARWEILKKQLGGQKSCSLWLTELIAIDKHTAQLSFCSQHELQYNTIFFKQCDQHSLAAVRPWGPQVIGVGPWEIHLVPNKCFQIFETNKFICVC